MDPSKSIRGSNGKDEGGFVFVGTLRENALKFSSVRRSLSLFKIVSYKLLSSILATLMIIFNG